MCNESGSINPSKLVAPSVLRKEELDNESYEIGLVSKLERRPS